jgi:hypothetical protein
MNAPAIAVRACDGRLCAFVAQPWRDLVAAIDTLAQGGMKAWLALAAAFVVTWFVYVPAHELLHAYGCIVAGGEVTRLEISPEYGGALLARVFPFVVSGSEYAGQLTGFDTHGSDAMYLATVLAPYLLTIFPGVMLLERRANAGTSLVLHAAAVGVALPLAFAPFISIAGDYYEAGSIVATRLAHESGWLPDPTRLRSDDVFKLAARLRAENAGFADWILAGASLVIGVVLALFTYRLGALLARMRRAPGSTTEISQ